MRLRLKTVVTIAIQLSVGYLIGWILLARHRQSTLFTIQDKENLSSMRTAEANVMIGVMTSRKYLMTRSAAIYDTWGRDVTGKLVFYVGEAGNVSSFDIRETPGRERIKTIHNLPIVELYNVNDTLYPPRQKSFAMLRHMAHNFGRHFRWFVRADDDLYIRYKKLAQFLQVLRLFRQSYDKNDYTETLEDKWYSALTLHPVKEPNLMLKLHLDFTQRQLQDLQRHRHKLESELKTMDKLINSREIAFEIKKHTSLSEIEATEKERQIDKLRGNLFETELSGKIEVNETSDWAFAVLGQKIVMAQDCSRCQRTIRQRAFKDLQMAVIHNHMTMKEGKVVATYLSYIPHRGLQSMITVSDGKGFQSFGLTFSPNALEWREFDHHALSITAFGSDSWAQTHVTETPKHKTSYSRAHPVLSSNQHQKDAVTSFPQAMTSSWPELHILLTLYRRYQPYLGFLNSLNQAARKYAGKVHLHVALYPDPSGKFKLILNITKTTHPLKINVVQMHGDFSKPIAYNTLARQFEGETIMVLIDVDMVLTEQFLYHVALNVQPSTAYFPVVFSQYSPEAVCYGRPKCTPAIFDFSRDSGLWRSFGYGMVALRAEDFHRTGGLDEGIKGWGKEDVDFFYRCVSKGIRIFRAVDVGLVHVYHEKTCDPHLRPDQMAMCRGSKGAMQGSLSTLAHMVLDIENNVTTRKERLL